MRRFRVKQWMDLIPLLFLFGGMSAWADDNCHDAAEQLLVEKTLGEFFDGLDELVVEQKREWVEIVSDIETSNKYVLRDREGNLLASVSERSAGLGGHLKRQIFGDHRPMEIVILNQNHEEVLRFDRPFKWLLSKMNVSARDVPLGIVKRRMALTKKVYQMCSAKGGSVLGTIKSPLWRPWTFPLLDSSGNEIGRISKKWGGFLKEGMSDADTFLIKFPGAWKGDEKAIFLAAAFAIDMDCFEKS